MAIVSMSCPSMRITRVGGEFGSVNHHHSAVPPVGNGFRAGGVDLDHHGRIMTNSGRGGGRLARRRCLASGPPASAPEMVVGKVTEVNKDTFWPIVKAATDHHKIVVLDMYTQWCGPCKVMAPKFQELSEKHLDVVFLKLDCNQENKPLAKELGIKVVPTFKILKDSKIVKEVTGAKFDDLVVAIENVKSS